MARKTSSTLPLLLTVGLVAVLIAAAVLLLDGGPLDVTGSGSPLVLGAPEDPDQDPSPSAFADQDPGAAPSGRQAMPAEPPPPKGPRRIAGRVVDLDTGKPIGAFQVTVLPDGDGDPVARLEEAPPQPFHQRHGVFSIAAEDGRYDVVVQAPGYLPTAVEMRVPGPRGAPEAIGLSKGPAIAGLVMGHDGYPRADLPVFLEVVALADPDAGPPRVKMTRTGVDGGFSFSPLPDGEYAVAALDPSNREDRVGGIRVYGRPVPVTIHLTARHQVSFRVQDLQGRPVDGARLELSGDDTYETGQAGRSGLIVVDNLRDGTYRLKVTASGHAVLEEEMVLEGGMGDHARWLTMDPLPPDQG